MANSPWASGPGEILQHGLSLLQRDSDTNRRLAMITIDNAVELMIKTFLGLPFRVIGIRIARDRVRDISESFPKLLDALEEHVPDKLIGIDLGEIEWYHRLRNELYHQGNGLTVERDKVEVYAELAKQLFRNLFGFDLAVKEAGSMELLGAFIGTWAELEKKGNELAAKHAEQLSTMRGRPPVLFSMFRELHQIGIIGKDLFRELTKLWEMRNGIVHGDSAQRASLTPEVVRRLRQVIDEFDRMIRRESPSAS